MLGDEVGTGVEPQQRACLGPALVTLSLTSAPEQLLGQLGDLRGQAQVEQVEKGEGEGDDALPVSAGVEEGRNRIRRSVRGRAIDASA